MNALWCQYIIVQQRNLDAGGCPRMRAVQDYVSWMLQSAQASTIARSLHWAEMPIKISHLAHDNILRNMTCISEYVLTHPPNPVPVLLPLTAVCGACYYDPRAADHTCAPRRRARGGESESAAVGQERGGDAGGGRAVVGQHDRGLRLVLSEGPPAGPHQRLLPPGATPVPPPLPPLRR